MNCNSCPESKLVLRDGEPAEMVMDPNSETCKSCMDELIKDTIERHKGTLDMLAKDDGPELKPCPFCGGVVELRDKMDGRDETYMIHCTGCHMWFEKFVWRGYGENTIIKEWNRRVKE